MRGIRFYLMNYGSKKKGNVFYKAGKLIPRLLKSASFAAAAD
jgi:hypothetical protein